MKTKEIRLKDYTINTKIIIKEHRAKYKKGSCYRQPLICYSFEIRNYEGVTYCGGFKTMKKLLKSMGEEL